MRCFLIAAACALLMVADGRADEPLVDFGPGFEAFEAGTCVAAWGDPAGVCRRPVASAVARAGIVPIVAARRVAERIQRRPLLRRVLLPGYRVGLCRR